MSARYKRAAPEALTAADLHEGLGAAADWLAAHAATLDRLNVFPVPDGDTGTNLLLSLRGVLAAIEGRDRSLVDFAAALAEAGLRAGRGNSGVLLGVWLGGLAATDPADALDGDALGRWLAAGASAARHAVAVPVEGTVLTAMDAAAAAATDGRPAERLEAAAPAARSAALATPAQLPLLAEAGVVDAGGLGFALFLDALAARIAGRSPAALPDLAWPAQVWREHLGSDRPLHFGRCLRFSLVAPGVGADALRQRLAGLGDSLVVAGAGERLSVHLHTSNAAAALAAARSLGPVEDLIDEDIDAAAARFLAAPARTAVVALVTGAGWRTLFESFGAAVVADASELRAAIEASPADDVIVLTNGLAAVSPAGATVLATDDLPSGLAALLALDPEAPAAANLEVMAHAAAAVRVVAARADAVRQVVAALLEAEAAASLLGLYYGGTVSEREAEALAVALRRSEAGLEVEVVFGGQPSPDYLVVVQA